MKRQTNYHALLRFLVCCLIGYSSLWSHANYEIPRVAIGALEYYLSAERALVAGMSYNVTSVEIPEKVNYGGVEYPVTEIYSGAFRECRGLTEVTIPNSVTSIGGWAFCGCSDLTTLTIGNSVTTIATSAFSNCSSLREVSIPNSVTEIRNQAFSGCCSLTEVTIPNSVTSIEVATFYGCSSLREVSIPNSVTEIRNEAFSGCSDLAQLHIGNSVKLIYELAFKDCSSLSEIILPNSLTAIGYGAFSGCTKLNEIDIPNSVSWIDSYAFENCNGLANVTLPNSIKSIEEASFKDCTSLTQINLPNSITSISKSAFEGCKSIAHITLSNSLSSIGDYAFSGCSTLTDITIPNSVTWIGESAFSNCTLINQVILPNSISYIGPAAFLGCIKLTQITIPNSLSSISNSTFESCSSLAHVSIPNSIATIGNYAFSKCKSLNSIIIGNSLTSIENNAFSDCNHLSSLATYSYVIKGIEECGLPKSIIIHLLTTGEIGQDVFSTNLTYFKNLLVENDGINYTFATAPKSFDFTNCIASNEGLFLIDCNKIISVKDAEKNDEVYFRNRDITEDLYSDNGFNFEPSLYHADNSFTAFKFNFTKEILLTEAGTLFNKVDLQDIEKIDKLSLEGNLNGTDIMTLNRMKSLKSLDLSAANIVEGGSTYRDNLTTANNVIGSYFFNDLQLSILKLPVSTTVIYDNALKGMSSLQLVKLGENIEEIRKYAFSGCKNISGIALPTTLLSINDHAFSGCSKLTEVTIPNSVTSIGTEAFYGCTTLESAILSNNLTEIRKSTFQNTGLKEIEIPNKVEIIGQAAFGGCSQLEKVILPASLTKAGTYAFAGCPAITQVYSLNTTPPVIDSSTFDSEVEENATLHVRKGSMVHYWLDPVWKEFKNMNEDLLCLDIIPNATYGDEATDLSQYAPEDVKLRYESSNSDVVEINGNMMRIVGAGEATVGAILDEEGGTEMELMGQMRQVVVNKADLKITVAEITIEQGQPLPDFSYLAEGLKYDDTLDDIEELPQPMCDVDENSPEGEYPVYFSEGNDRNYNITTRESKVIVSKTSAVNTVSDGMTDLDSEVEVYTLNGMLIYKGSRKEAQLEKGIYIVRQGNVAVKINVQ